MNRHRIAASAIGSTLGRLALVATIATTDIVARAPLILARPSGTSGEIANERSGSSSAYLHRFYQQYISDLRYGRCRFEPSCSQYGIESIEEYGFLKGVALTADRLIRCNQEAGEFYARTPSGRLSDPADNSRPLPSAPRVPEWLLPAGGAASFLPLSIVLNATDSLAVPNARIAETAAFADALALSGDCERAVTEYKRVAFLANTDDAAEWSFFKIGDCYFRNGQWSHSASAYLGAAKQSSSPFGKVTGLYMAAASYFDDGEYGKAVEALDDCTVANGTVSVAKIQALHGLSTLALGDWKGSAEAFAQAADTAADESFRERAIFLAENNERGASLPEKHANLAAGFSAVIPGSGQMYAGRWYDGVRHLIVNGLLIFTVYQLADDDLWAAAYLTAGITLPFYVGNVIGARRSVELYNASKRTDFVSDLVNQSLRVGSREQ